MVYPKFCTFYNAVAVFFSFFLGGGGCTVAHEDPRIGVESELQLPAYSMATAMPESHVGDLHQSLWQSWILNPLSEATDQTFIIVDASQIHFH